MPIIAIQNLGNLQLEVTDPSKTLLQNFQIFALDWMHACGGKGRCTTCKVIVLEGRTHLSPLTPAELKYREQGNLSEGERLACQAKSNGDIRISVPEECKLPHLRYSE